MTDSTRTAGWETRSPGDRNRHKHVHYIEFGVSACYLIGSSTRPLIMEPEPGSLVCTPCAREVERRHRGRAAD